MSKWMVERFTQSLTIQTSIEEGLNWRKQLQRFLRAYRATPHPCTGVPPAIWLGLRRYKTRLPCPVSLEETVNSQRMKKKDAEIKMKMKANADQKAYVKPNPVNVVDWVLCKQSKQNKLTTPYYQKPIQVPTRKGTWITAIVDGKQITRHANHFKMYHPPRSLQLILTEKISWILQRKILEKNPLVLWWAARNYPLQIPLHLLLRKNAIKRAKWTIRDDFPWFSQK